MPKAGVHVRPLYAFFLRRLSREQSLLWVILVVLGVYLTFVSPYYARSGELRLLLFNMGPIAIFPLLLVDPEFRPQGWIRLLLSARPSVRELFVAYAAARVTQALLVGTIFALLVGVVSFDAMTPARAAHLWLGSSGFAIWVAAVASLASQLAKGKAGILLTYLLIASAALISLKAPAGGRLLVEFVWATVSLASIESAARSIGHNPWIAVACIPASVIWWLSAYSVFRWKCGR